MPTNIYRVFSNRLNALMETPISGGIGAPEEEKR
jgi:hypothetical protein